MGREGVGQERVGREERVWGERRESGAIERGERRARKLGERIESGERGEWGERGESGARGEREWGDREERERR